MNKLDILIVDDSQSVRMFLNKILRDELQANVTEASNGKDAFKLIQNNFFDVVFMDVNMPGKSGLDVIKRVRTKLNDKHLPIIVITELEREDLIRQAFQVGATDYISKPLHPIEIFSRMKARIETHELMIELNITKKIAEDRNNKLKLANKEIVQLKEKEKADVYKATISGSQHIINNLLNKLQLIELEMKKHSGFSPEKIDMLRKMTLEAKELLKKLSSVKDLDEVSIKKSVYPK